jgi:hypothetical protein
LTNAIAIDHQINQIYDNEINYNLNDIPINLDDIYDYDDNHDP